MKEYLGELWNNFKTQMLPVWQTLNTERRSEKTLAGQTKNKLRQQYEQHVREALGGEPVKAELPTPSRPTTTEMMQNETSEQGRFFGGEEAAKQAAGAAAKGSSKAVANEAKGLIGKDFESFLANKLGGNSSF